MWKRFSRWVIAGLTIFSLGATSLLVVNLAPSASSGQIEPTAGSWKTWALSSGSQFRLAAPPDKAATDSEIKQLKDIVANRDASTLDKITYWDTGAPSFRWNEIAMNEALKGALGVNLAARDMSLVHVAIYDALVAAWDTKYTYNRQRPSQVDSSLTTVLANPNSPAYPSEQAVAAGAASTVLAYLFPADAKLFADQVTEAAQSRLSAGVDYPSDVTAGLALGQKVGALVVARGKADGSDAQWTGSVPTEKGKWNGTNPAFPMGGTWKTWVLSSGSEFRPGPPPASDSDQEKADLAELENWKRTPEQTADAYFWQFGAGPTRGVWYFNELTSKLIGQYRWDDNPLRVARAYALVSIADYDSTVAVFDAKYTYWAIRPFMLDPKFTPLFTTPNHPSYPAAHSTISGTVAAVMAYLFPRDADTLNALAKQAGESRIWAGIHFRSDVETGFVLATKVAQKIVDYAKADGSS